MSGEGNSLLSNETSPVLCGSASEENKLIIKRRKPPEPGLIYISYLPPNMTPLHIRQIFEKYGEVGRIFLQPESRCVVVRNM